jgi:hypothetical protein
MYLHIEFVDGNVEHHFIGSGIDKASVRVQNECLHLFGGDGSYRLRGTYQSWPLAQIKTWRVNEEREG